MNDKAESIIENGALVAGTGACAAGATAAAVGVATTVMSKNQSSGKQGKRGTQRPSGRSSGDTIKLAVYDNTFKISLVYLYCGYSDYVGLKDQVFADPCRDTPMANGLCSFGGASEAAGWGNACVVWVNSERVSRDEIIYTLLHEISHLADNVLDAAGVNDSTGEARAYILGREAARVLPLFCGTKPVVNRQEAKLEALVNGHAEQEGNKQGQ